MGLAVGMVCLDLDGTLVEGGGQVVPAANVEAVRLAAKAGVKIVIATGRPYFRAAELVDQLGVYDAMVVLNGAAVLDGEGRFIRRAPLYGDQVDALYDLIRSLHLVYRGYTWDAVTQYARAAEGWWTRDPLPPLDRGVPDVPFPSLMPRDDVFKVTMINVRADLELTDIRSSLPPGLQLLSAAACARDWLEFTQQGATKLLAVKCLAESWGVRRERVMAIGDHENDLELVRWAGLGVYVGNAPPQLKKYARVVAPHAACGGVAWAIRRYVLGEEDSEVCI